MMREALLLWESLLSAYDIADAFRMHAAMKKAEMQNWIEQFKDAFGFCVFIFCV